MKFWMHQFSKQCVDDVAWLLMNLSNGSRCYFSLPDNLQSKLIKGNINQIKSEIAIKWKWVMGFWCCILITSNRCDMSKSKYHGLFACCFQFLDLFSVWSRRIDAWLLKIIWSIVSCKWSICLQIIDVFESKSCQELFSQMEVKLFPRRFEYLENLSKLAMFFCNLRTLSQLYRCHRASNYWHAYGQYITLSWAGLYLLQKQ